MDLVVLEDAARVSALFAAAHPQRLGELTRPHARRWVLGDAIGYVALWCVHETQFHVELIVDHAHRRAGHGTRLLAHATAEATHAGARSMQVRPQATDEASIAFATKRGFTETMPMSHLVLDLRDARHDELRDVMDRLAGQGIAIVTLADFTARSKDPEAALIAASADLEMPDLRDDPHAIVAEQRGRLVGFTSVFGTGVRRELRGCGVATAMKVAAIDAALARGETMLSTTTGHPALRHIAEKLGYRERACELHMVRRL